MRTKKRFLRLMKQRRFMRYSLLASNLIVLGVIVLFVVQSSPALTTSRSSIGSGTAANANDPLDQLSSADIAVNLAQMTNLPEATAVTNQADSVGAELAVPPAHTAIIAKPQAVSTDLKSKKDITTYVAQNGDTVAGIAAKFGVTSDSIKWSNNLSSDSVDAGTKLTIPPINGIVYTVKAGDTADSIATKYRSNRDQIVFYNDAEISGLSAGEQIIIPNGQQPAPTPVIRSRAALGAFAAVYGYNGYDYGFCTWYVANRRAQVGHPVPSNLGNASTWDDRAAAAGLPVSRTPTVGAAGVTSQRGAGHVVFVEQVNDDGSIWVSEMNSHGQASMTNTARAGGWGRVDWKLFSAGQASGFNYIH